MELYGAVPHIIIDVAPNDLPSGKDPQLEKAIDGKIKDSDFILRQNHVSGIDIKLRVRRNSDPKHSERT